MNAPWPPANDPAAQPLGRAPLAPPSGDRYVLGWMAALVVLGHYLALDSLASRLATPASPPQPRWEVRAVSLMPPPAPTAQATAATAPPPPSRPRPHPHPNAASAPSPEAVSLPEPPAADHPPQPSTPETTTTLAPVSPEPQTQPPPPEDVTPTQVAAGSATPVESEAPPPPPLTLPGSTRLQYDLHGLSRQMQYQARGELLWRHDGQVYEAKLEVSALFIGARSQTSRGRITAQGLTPERFGDQGRREQAAHFDWAQRQVIFSANTPPAPLSPGAQDRLSIMLQMAARVAGQPSAYPPGSQLPVQTISARESETWVIEVEARETLQLPGGELDTLRLVRQPRRPFDQRIEVWLAPALAYLPARIRITNANGDFVDQQWRATAE